MVKNEKSKVCGSRYPIQSLALQSTIYNFAAVGNRLIFTEVSTAIEVDKYFNSAVWDPN